LKKSIIYFISFCLIILLNNSCNKCNDNVNYRNEMRSFVSNISTYSKIYNPNFIIIPQNGQDLAILSDSNIAIDYISKIDAQAREDMYYGYNKDDETTPTDISNEWEKQLDIIKSYNKTILTIDYCSSSIKMDDAYSKNNTKGYNSFSADQRNLNNIPTHTINNENSLDILSIKDAKNFLYLINGENFTTKRALIDAIKNTNYDAIVMDLNQNEEIFSASEINELKVKKNGASRLVICYMSIGEAEDYRYYWQNKWKINKPEWLGKSNPDWKGNYKVCYWNNDWQNIIYGNDNSYLKKIIDANFDGVYLDIIDAFEYYEENN